MYGKCSPCKQKKMGIACGSANCQAVRVYEPQDVMQYITATKEGYKCELPFWYWGVTSSFKTSENDLIKFVGIILNDINGTI